MLVLYANTTFGMKLNDIITEYVFDQNEILVRGTS
jgi:hypothetical protein